MRCHRISLGEIVASILNEEKAENFPAQRKGLHGVEIPCGPYTSHRGWAGVFPGRERLPLMGGPHHSFSSSRILKGFEREEVGVGDSIGSCHPHGSR